MTVVSDIASYQEAGARVVEKGLSLAQMSKIVNECRLQPSWRNMADKCVDYYDGNQLDGDTLAALDRKGMGPIQRNITAPLVNVVLGMEAKTRTDWIVSADGDEMQDVAEAMSEKLHEAEREARADRACADAYAGEIKAGLGWVEVSRSNDPFSYPYRVMNTHRREMWWDWRDQTPDLSNSGFLLRKRWYDVDQVCAYFPQHHDILKASLGDPLQYQLIQAQRGMDLGQSLEEDRGYAFEDYEAWRNFERERICLYETWYRRFVRGYVAKSPNGEVIEISVQNPLHLALISRGLLRPQLAVYSKLAMSLWAGPHKLMDAPVKKRYLPYVPFWGYREDRTGVPYGLVRAMLTPQDEVNARLQKMMWLLGAKRVVMDSDALDLEMQSPQDLLDELARPDAVVFLNRSRLNKDGFNIDDNLALADAQFKVLQDAMQSAQQVVGVFNAMLGRDSSTTAASAINSLVEQGMTALAEINDNYRFARRLVGERLLDLIRDDMIGQPVQVIVGEVGRKRVISLNQRVAANSPEAQAAMQATPEEQAVMQLKNNVAAARLKVSLDDVQSSASYREQQFTMLAELTKGLPPNLQAAIAPFIMEASNLRDRRKIADTLRKTMGQAIPRTPEEERAAEAQQQQAMAEMQQIQREGILMELREREAKVNKLNAEAEKVMAEARTIGAGNPELDGARGEYEQRIRDMEMASRESIDRLAAELMQVRSDSAARETKLIGELAKAVATLKANAGSREAEIRKAEIEKEIAEIEAKRDRDVAEINARQEKVVESLAGELAKLREEMATRIEVQSAKTEKLVAGVEKRVERAVSDAERREEKREGSERKESQPIVVDATGAAGKALEKVAAAVERSNSAVAEAVARMADAETREPEEAQIEIKKVGDTWVGTKTVGGKSRTVKVGPKKNT